MILNLTELSAEPLNAQISRQIREQILAGELMAGQIIPSIRSLSRECRVSAITVQRAYDDLEREGMIVARHGRGFYVARQSAITRRKTAKERLYGHLYNAIISSYAEGLKSKDVKQVIEKVLLDTNYSLWKDK